MEDGLGESKDRSAALLHFVENMSEEEVAALRRALRNVGRLTNRELTLPESSAAVGQGFAMCHRWLSGRELLNVLRE
jgi:hypothetical protein